MYPLEPIDSLWKMATVFGQIYLDLTGSLGVSDPTREIGFAATNGMLSTLDRGCALVPAATYEPARAKSVGAGPGGPVVSGLLGSGVGYVLVRSLATTTTKEVEDALAGLRAAGSGPLRGLVLDLRGNPGGLLDQVVQVANVFVAEGVLLKYLARSGKQVEERRAVQGGVATTIPLVVLVNEKTASGAEAIAAALKDRDRAVVVGQRTMGLGTIQVIYEVGDTDGSGKAYLKLTIARLIRPSGAILDGLGVVPDIALARTSPAGAPAPAAGEKDAGPRWNPFGDPTIPRLPTEERALAEVAYTAPEPHSGGSPDRPPLEDFEVRLARDILLRTSSARRSEMLQQAGAVAAERR
jgi:hypothetical protein